MQVKDIMTSNPACCTPGTSLEEVAKMMVDHDCGCIPVVDGNDTITLSDHTKITFVGVTSLSESDFTKIGGKHDFVPKS